MRCTLAHWLVHTQVAIISAFHIVEEPLASSTAGVPFAGTLRVELLDQRGERILSGSRRVELSLRRSDDATLSSTAAWHVGPTVQPRVWCGTSAGGWCAPTVVASSGGGAYFAGITIDGIGSGAYFEVAVEGIAAPQRTNTSYTVRRGPASLLRFLRAPDDTNLMVRHLNAAPCRSAAPRWSTAPRRSTAPA